MTFAFAPLSYTLPYWPEHLFGHPDFLDRVGVSKFEIASVPGSLSMAGKLNILHALEMKLPALDAVSAVFFADATGTFTEIDFTVQLAPDFSVALTGLDVSLRVQSNLLTAVKQTNGKWVPLTDAQNNAKPVSVDLSGASVKVSADGDIDIQGFNQIAMTAMAIGDTGIVIEVLGVQLHLSDLSPPIPDAPPGFKGVAIDSLAVHLGDNFEGFGGPNDITASKLFIGSSGFSGTVGAGWSTPPAGKFLGLSFSPKSIDFTFAQNKLTGMSLKGDMTLPFFDKELEVDIGYDANGGLTIGISAAGGVFALAKPGFVEVAVESIEIDVKDKKALVRISGMLTPLYGSFDWPSFEMRELSIDSDGHVELKGGWIDLPTQKALNFNAFTVEITKFGMGKVAGGGRWVGFSGKVNLIKGVKGNASVDGLRITLPESGPPQITLDGVGVDMKVAGAFELKGSVKFTDDGIDKRFDGAAMLSLKKPELVFDTRLTIGQRDDPANNEKFKFFAMYGGLELPAGIPLGPSGAAIFGFAGLLALNMKPGRDPLVPWYAMPPESDWYHKTTIGVNDFTKWDPKKDGKAFGAGLTIGTYADNGFTFNARALVVLAFPGPLLLIEGLGNLLKDRKELSAGDEPLFRAIAIFDIAAGEYTFGLDAFYQYDAASGDVITIRGSLEAFYKKSDPRAWHIWLGKKDPKTSRIQARIISLFEVASYFMIDAKSVQMGAWIGYDKQWHPGPLSITLQAWLDANAVVSFKPNHFHGDLWLHAAIELSAFGIGAGLIADAMLAADIMDPFHIKGELSVTLELPWPLKDISKDVTLEWGPKGQNPPIPAVLQSVAIEHLKSSAVWPLAWPPAVKPALFSDGYDISNGYLVASNAVGALSAPPSNPPIVPMDGRPSIAFGRAVHDDAMIGVNALPRVPALEQIGDASAGQGPAQLRYALSGIVLEKWQPVSASWVGVAGKGPMAANLPPLYGSWAAVPSAASLTAVDQTKLMLWSKTAFDQTRFTGPDWNDWFTGAYPNYPCVDVPTLRCYDFEGYPPGPMAAAAFLTDFIHQTNPGLRFSSPGGWKIVALAQPIDGRTHSLREWRLPSGRAFLNLYLDAVSATGTMHIIFDASGEKVITVDFDDAGGTANVQNFTVNSDKVEIAVAGTIRHVLAVVGEIVGIVEVCLGARTDQGTGNSAQDLQALAANLISSTSVWSAQGNVLEPDTDYRLVIATKASVAAGAAVGPQSQTSYAYFKTGGPPVLGGFTVPDGQTQQSIDAGPDRLTNYVHQTIPATVAQSDAAPAMPRPVFRAYDVGVEFNADYVDLLYKMSYRDLMLQILDSNGAPARDDLGRALSFENPWGVTSNLTLDTASASWLAAIDPHCVPIDPNTILHNQTLGTSRTPLLLDPATRYKARLVPLLLHQDFSAPRYANGVAATGAGARIGDWLVAELDTVAQASKWTVSNGTSAGASVTQSVALAGGATSSTDCPPGSALIWAPVSGGAPLWKSLRLNAFVSSAAGAAIGLVFLYRNQGDYFEFTMRQSDGVCRLIRWSGGVPTSLADVVRPFAASSDIEISIEVCDTAIRVFVDSAPAISFELDLAAHSGGTIGAWCWNNTAARFKDVRVEDQSGQAATAYGFEFVTSNYLNYFHLAHGRRTPVWDIETAGTDKERTAAELAQLTTMFAQQPDVAAPETRQYEDLAALWLGPGLVRDPETTEINRILRNGKIVAWLVRSPEPWDWKRSRITLSRMDQAVAPISEMLGPVKITGAALGMSDANDEYTGLLMMEQTSLNGWRLEMRDASASDTGFIDAAFDDPASTWSTLYQFTAQNVIKAGMRIRLYSGGAPQPAGSHTQLSMNIAAPGNPGVAKYPSVGADLRLLDPSGRTACAIRILPEAGFGPLQVPAGVRMLRKGDATGLILVPGADDAFAPGAYALSMNYRRDISVGDPDSIVLSQAGNTTDEQAFVPLY
jgi:hypothetical protein